MWLNIFRCYYSYWIVLTLDICFAVFLLLHHLKRNRNVMISWFSNHVHIVPIWYQMNKKCNGSWIYGHSGPVFFLHIGTFEVEDPTSVFFLVALFISLILGQLLHTGLMVTFGLPGSFALRMRYLHTACPLLSSSTVSALFCCSCPLQCASIQNSSMVSERWGAAALALCAF